MKNSADSQFTFDKSAAVAERLIVLQETASTNDDAAALARDAAHPAPAFSVVVTTNQTAGRGRLGRAWVATSGKTLAVSVIVRPDSLFERPDSLAWIPLISGIAMSTAVQSELEYLHTENASAEASEQSVAPEVRLKWPNDVLIDGYKVSGILTELLADQRAVVVGSGVNLTLDEHDLPTLTSTSLKLAASQTPNADRLLARYLTELRSRIDVLLEHRGDAIGAGLQGEVNAVCGTLGSSVRVQLPNDTDILGIAETIDASGRLVVVDHAGAQHVVSAGDVTHLRVEA